MSVEPPAATISVLDPAGHFSLAGSSDALICDVLRSQGIPLSAVRVFEMGDGEPMRAVSVAERLGPAGRDLVAIPLRNIPLRISVVGAPSVDLRGGEGFVADGPTSVIATSYTAGDVLSTAVDETRRVLRLGDTQPQDRRLIVGYSGGGDSVLMGAALGQLREEFAGVHLVMVLGVRDWDRQLDDALTLAGTELRVVDRAEVAACLGVRSLDELFREFARRFPGVGNEVIGTWMVREVLGEIAAESQASHILLGFNREDLIAESLYRLSQGELPLPAPVRVHEGLRLAFPLWRLPKRFIDSYSGEVSIRNSLNRDPSPDLGRAGYYRAAYGIAEAGPGFDLDLLEGLSRLAQVQQRRTHRVPVAKEVEDDWNQMMADLRADPGET